MKLLLALLLSSISLAAQDTGGIVFQEKSFADLLVQAKAEDKLIFIDAYTTWCGPCKMMTAKVFPDDRVGAVYNERFINAKFDMEKGEGPGLAARYSVNAYPTYLFINGDGDLLHKGLGYIPKPALLELADAAISDESIGALQQRYDAGERDATFVKTFARALVKNREAVRANGVVDDYLSTQDDWSTPTNLELLLANAGQVGGKRMAYLIEQAAEIEAVTGRGSVIRPVELALVNDYHNTNRHRTLVAPEKIQSYLEEEGGALGRQLNAAYAMLYYENTGKMEEYVSAAVAYYTVYPTDSFTELNLVAWNFFEHADDPDDLALAIGWAKRSVALNTYYPNLDTLAWLYRKTGQQELAEATATRAIEMAKAAEMDYSGTEQIFE